MVTRIPSTRTLNLTEDEKSKVKQLCEKIKKEVPFIDLKPYSHNIIGFCLLEISQIAGREYANKLIDHFDLTWRGWTKAPEED